MGNISNFLRVSYHEFIMQSIAGYPNFKEHYKELINENALELDKIMTEINNSRPFVQEKKSNVRNIDIEKNYVTEKSVELLEDIESSIQLKRLESFKTIITKNFKKAEMTSFKKAFEFIDNLNNSLKSYPSLSEYTQRTKELYDKSKEISSNEGGEISSKKISIKDINKLNKEWDDIYSTLKHLIQAHFKDDKTKYKLFFKDLH